MPLEIIKKWLRPCKLQIRQISLFYLRFCKFTLLVTLGIGRKMCTMFSIRPLTYCLRTALSLKPYRLYASTSQSGETIMNVFNRKAKRLQRDRTALLPDYKVYEYLKEEVCFLPCHFCKNDKILDEHINFNGRCSVF